MTLEALKKRVSSEFLLYLFYLFLAVFGFVAGTRIWLMNDAPPVFALQLISPHIADLLLVLCAPGAAVTAVVFVLALFAAGWFILPVIVYLIGALFGLICCAFFGAQGSEADLLILVTFSMCYLCTLAVCCFMCVYAHRLSRSMSGSGGGRAYIDFGKNTLCAAAVMTVTDIAFAGALYLQITSA